VEAPLSETEPLKGKSKDRSEAIVSSDAIDDGHLSGWSLSDASLAAADGTGVVLTDGGLLIDLKMFKRRF